ncbi:MAG: tetratricopeptide repeat protein [Euryarchaeota archaeon]|nr:tetratricopeptide repeat protein [Euryarchaeota archaeon]HRU11491.1 tetratricopeptide repeat protein [Methanomassiliicoccales archaeon]
MATPITVGERIVLHLAQYSKHMNDFDAPFEVSQDGIGEALRISRAHAAIELKKLKEAGTVTERIAHIRAGPVKRKVYFLTEAGEAKARDLKDFANRQGIELSPLLDLRKCKGEELWAQLNPDSRALLAKAVVFRKPFKRSALPQTTISLLPEDKEGMVDMPPALRESIPRLMDRGALREAHSFAADYWLEEGDYVERLHHLLQANRTLEAQMLLSNRGWQMALTGGPELLASLKELDHVLPRYAREIRRVKGETALRNRDAAYGLLVAEEMLASGDADERLEGAALKGRSLLIDGKAQPALDLLLEVRKARSDPLLDCDIAKCYSLLGQKEEALQMVEAIGRRGGIEDPDVLEEVYHRKGQVLASLGRYQEAIANLSKAIGLARPGDKREIFKAMAACYEALGMDEKAREYNRKAVRRSGSA